MNDFIISTIIKLITSIFLNSNNIETNIDIDNAPNWFYKQPSDKICYSYYRNTDLNGIDNSTDIAKIKLANRIRFEIEKAIYKSKLSKSKKEYMLDKLVLDRDLQKFVDYYSNVLNISHKKNKTFVRVCINKKELIKYESNKIKQLKVEYVKQEADEAYKDLDQSIKK